jgi:hypothetical protein
MAERPSRLEIGHAREGEGHIVDTRGIRGSEGFRLHLEEVLPERLALDRIEQGVGLARERLGDRRSEVAARALRHDLDSARPACTVMGDLGDGAPKCSTMETLPDFSLQGSASAP